MLQSLTSTPPYVWMCGQAPPGSDPSLSHPFALEEEAVVTNEHTAQMTLSRSAALEYYEAGK